MKPFMNETTNYNKKQIQHKMSIAVLNFDDSAQCCNKK